ncbi:MAG: hypothetical protein K2Y05_09440 [Hyphomicrobiaceae bacterium]|nr:hypothetical protein [Hyphomicrobiaceae bacterium]
MPKAVMSGSLKKLLAACVWSSAVSVVALAGLSAAASAAEHGAGHGVTVFQRSAYTTIDLSSCQRTKTADGEWHLCQGLPGYSVYVAEGDLRTFIAASTSPVKSRAAVQTLRAFNTPFKGKSVRVPVEWRFVMRNGKQVPYAAIVKFYTKNSENSGEVFVVMKIAGPETCHVAYVDAVASKEAIVLARQIADERAAAFDCKNDPEPVGIRGTSPM